MLFTFTSIKGSFSRMARSRFSLSLALVFLTPCVLHAGRAQTTMHKDGRTTPKLFIPARQVKSKQAGREVADEFVVQQQDTFDFNADHLSFVSSRKSLLGTHYRYQQMLHGYAVIGAELVVSVDKDGAVYQAYNNTYPVSLAPEAPAGLIGGEVALDKAWNHLRVHGKVLAVPAAQAMYLPEGGAFRLVYRTRIAVKAPFGDWEHTVDAATGAIVKIRDRVIYRKPVKMPSFAEYKGEIWPRKATTAKWVESQRTASAPPLPAPANGSAVVFDGDPRTLLADETLVDSSPASAFDGAYVTRTLNDINNDAGIYRLQGPWVSIVDFEEPTTPPSTTTDGNWTAQRGNNAFNDVMSYFHIDQNQRYLQSLGYTGSAGIQAGSIEVDSDGFFGFDNSYYAPATNQLAFGHGGVDDNEDPDVILHEYGHALTEDIIPGWGSGDALAIGEGFGDYWGASYSYTTSNGTTFHPAWAFSWDGHSSDTWSGRSLDRTELTYDPSHTYDAHETINGIENYSDQLWGTPLFQAFLELVAAGRPREEVDRIVIESLFGVGTGPSMRDMANATVNAAERLYPGQMHAAVFRRRFAAQLILDGPAMVIGSLSSSNTTETGGTVTFSITLAAAPANDVTVTLTSNDTTEGTIDQDTFVFEAAAWNTPQTFTVTGVDDSESDGNVAYRIELTSSSVDTDFDGLTTSIGLTNTDNDLTGTGSGSGGAPTKDYSAGDNGCSLGGAGAMGLPMLLLLFSMLGCRWSTKTRE